MKLKTTIKGIESVIKKLNDLEKVNVPVATARALNWIAFNARSDLQFEMARVFDRPTKYTLNSVFVQKANANQRFYQQFATVFIKDSATKGTAPVKYLSPQIYGGSRPVKRFEQLLADAGHIRSGQYLLPFKAMMNAYGNVSAGTIQKVLSGLQAQADGAQNSPVKGAGYRGTRAKRSVPVRYSVVQRNGRAVIMQYQKGRTVPLFVAVDSVQYSKRFEFFKTVERSVGRNMMRAFEREFRKG